MSDLITNDLFSPDEQEAENGRLRKLHRRALAEKIWRKAIAMPGTTEENWHDERVVEAIERVLEEHSNAK